MRKYLASSVRLSVQVIVLLSAFVSLSSYADLLSVIDGSKIFTKENLHSKLAKDLNFPSEYGANLDALYDSLTDLKEPTIIKITNFYALERNLGKVYTQGFIEVLKDSGEVNPKVVFVLSSSK